MTGRKIALVSPGRTSSGGSAFAAGLAPALRRLLGPANVVEASVPVAGRIELPEEVRSVQTVVFAGSRADRVPGARTVFWPLNVAPFEKHVVVSEASSLRNRARHLALRRRLARSVDLADGLVFGSLHARTLYQGAYPQAAVKPYSINPGGTPSGLKVTERRTDEGPPLVLVVSHLYPYKGILQFVEAVATCRARLPEGVHFRVTGADRDEVHAREVHRRVAELGLGERFVVAPADQGEMTDLYARATLAVFPSTCENAGSFALYDGLHAGVPTLCSDRSSMPEMVGGSVRLVNPFQPSLMGKALVELLADESARAELSALAVGWARSAPTWDDRAALLDDFVRTLEVDS